MGPHAQPAALLEAIDPLSARVHIQP